MHSTIFDIGVVCKLRRFASRICSELKNRCNHLHYTTHALNMKSLIVSSSTNYTRTKLTRHCLVLRKALCIFFSISVARFNTICPAQLIRLEQTRTRRVNIALPCRCVWWRQGGNYARSIAILHVLFIERRFDELCKYDIM